MSTNLKNPPHCPNCGKLMPAGPLAGFCPACLLAQGADRASGDGSDSGRFDPPSVEELAGLFPQFEILGLIGAGGMGAVYKARQPALDRLVALKVLPAISPRGANFEERFNREARALARLHHPNIVAVHEFGRAGALHYFVMEFVDGTNLRSLEQAGRLSPRESLQIIPQICDALQYAHDEGVVHRDIKPENVLVDRKGRVKIADFGLAKILGAEPEAARLTAEGQVMGTPHYMAPEQVERPLTVDHRADIYALGVVLYEMLTGDLPLGKFAPPSRKVQVDVRLDDVVLRALENDPARRYQKASEVKTQVEHIASTPDTGGSSTPPSILDGTLLRWAGFPLVTLRDGKRRVNRKEAFKMFVIFFGLLTLAFGLVSLVHGENLFGWLGIAGKASL
ncbi:MAG: serine/threonine protein kinase, partial [Verrucomicrobia bacterium]|nr:serine/threonine protein kinase [Verrucomicrobiota bacterium]